MGAGTTYIQNTSTIVDSDAVGDDIFFVRGDTPVTGATLNKSGIGATGLGKVFLAHPWGANIGTSGTPFEAEISADTDSILDNQAGGGTLFYSINGTADECDLVRSHGPGNRRTELQTTGVVAALEVTSGVVNVNTPVAATTVRIGGSGTVLMPDAASTDPTLVEIGGGTWKTERGAATVVQFGGLADVDAGTNAITTWNLYGGVAMIRQMGTLATLNWYGGVLDLSKLGRDMIFTTVNVWGYVYPAALRDLERRIMITSSTINYRMRHA